MLRLLFFFLVQWSVLGALSTHDDSQTERGQKPRRRALMVVINQFESGGRVSHANLYTTNDSTLMYRFFRHQQFDEVVVLYNQEATVQAVKRALHQFAINTRPGDLNVVYISSHGYHLAALRPKSEKDGQDEVVICYDTPPILTLEAHWQKDKRSTRQQEVLVDDDLGGYFDTITNQMGKQGHLLFLLDACSSNTGSRNTNASLIKSPFRKGGPADLELDEAFDLSAELSADQEPPGLVALFAAQEGGAAFVFKKAKLSAMTYGFLVAIRQVQAMSKPMDYTQLEGRMRTIINEVIDSNYMAIGGNSSLPRSSLCLGGHKVTQRTPVLQGKLTRIQLVVPHPKSARAYQAKGEVVSIHTDDFGVTLGSQYTFWRNEEKVATGKVVAIQGDSLEIHVTEHTIGRIDDWSQITPVLTERNLTNLSLPIWVETFENQLQQKRLIERIQQEEVLRVARTKEEGRIHLVQQGREVVGYDGMSGTELARLPLQEGLVIDALKNQAVYALLKQLIIPTERPQIQLSILPAHIQCYCDGKLVDKKDTHCPGQRTFVTEQTYDRSYFHTRQGKPAVDTSMQVVLTIQNLTKEALYFQVLDVDPFKKITPLFPAFDDPCQSGGCRLLEPKEVYAVLIADFYPPFGLEEFQVITSRRPFDIRPFLKAIQHAPPPTRGNGSKGSTMHSALNGAMTSLSYYIIPNEEKNARLRKK